MGANRDGSMTQKVAVLLPALNEETTIGRVIDDIPLEALEERGYEPEVLVVDGHSTDRTQEIALSKGARMIIQRGRGKGDAIRSAFKEFDGDYLFMLDSDNTYPPMYILNMLNHLDGQGYDVVMGSRLGGYIEPGAMTRVNRFGNVVLSATANAFFPNGHKTTDVCTGMWGFRGDIVKDLVITANHFEVEAEMYAKCVKNGYKIGEIPIRYGRRKTPSKLLSIRDGCKIFWKLCKLKTEH